jgi:hypothetical protein
VVAVPMQLVNAIELLGSRLSFCLPNLFTYRERSSRGL